MHVYHVYTCIYFCKVLVKYRSGVRAYNVQSPKRRQSIKRSVCRSLLSTSEIDDFTIKQIKKKIRDDLSALASNDNTILKSGNEGLESFDWDNVWKELQSNAPTFVNIVSILIANAAEHRRFVCFLCALMLRQRNLRLSFVQRAISVFLYSQGCSKQVSFIPDIVTIQLYIPQFVGLFLPSTPFCVHNQQRNTKGSSSARGKTRRGRAKMVY